MKQSLRLKIDRFFSTYRTLVFEKGEIIIQAEQEPNGVFYLLEGRVVQYDILPNGTEAVVNVFQIPSFFPMSWAINKTPNHFFYEAQTRVVAKQAPASEVVDFLKTDPETTLNLLARTFRGAEGMLRRMTFLMGGDAKSRLQFELLNTAYRFGTYLPDGSVRLDLTETDLAKRSGLARETVSRTLRALKSDNVVSIEQGGGSIVLLDIKELENQADIDS
ncbi:Crp/Fnr family transcriptional regulator [Pedobacter sp.]|nr:Crp/Fnr family transcriptional regulator [Candidatus Saccharibacteria bacterium]